MVRQNVVFTEPDVRRWCLRTGDENQLHSNSADLSDEPFNEPVVPGMQIIDHLSGMLTELGGDDETVILTGISGVRFREPVYFGETVVYELRDVEEMTNSTTVAFDCVVKERDELAVSGVISVTIE